MSRGLAYYCGFLAVLILCAAFVGAACADPVRPTVVFTSSVSPGAGTMLGGTPITISGAGFQSGARLEIGGNPAPANVVSSNKITAETPAHAAGKVIIVVINPDGRRAEGGANFTYEVDPAFSVSGVVTELTEQGEIAVEGVRVEESATNISTTTDARGEYRLSGLRRAEFEVSMTKPGYDTGPIPVNTTSDMRLDRRIERLASSVLSGMVYETTPNGRVPLDGVVLYCDACGSPVGHTFVTTDANGLYRFEWTLNGKTWIRFISKDGYRYAGPIEPPGIPVNVIGDTRFDIELVKR